MTRHGCPSFWRGVAQRTNRRRRENVGSVKARPATALVLCLVFCVAPPAFGQENQDEPDGGKQLAHKIHETVEAIHAVRLERLRLQEQHESNVGEIERQIERLRDDLEKTDAAVREEAEKLHAVKAQVEQDKRAKRAAELLVSQVAASVLDAAGRMAKRVSAGIPYRKPQRQEQIGRVVEELGDSDLLVQADALTDYFSFCAEELRLAGSVHLWNEPVLLDGGKRQTHTYQVRLGLVNQFFVSEDGETVGLAARRTDREWDLQVDRSRRRQLRVILDVLQQRRPPEIVPVPCAASAVRRAAKNASDDQSSGRGTPED